jgi:hypothetical protein
MLTWDDLSVILDSLDKACHNFDNELIRQILLDSPTGLNLAMVYVIWFGRS